MKVISDPRFSNKSSQTHRHIQTHLDHIPNKHLTSLLITDEKEIQTKRREKETPFMQISVVFTTKLFIYINQEIDLLAFDEHFYAF